MSPLFTKLNLKTQTSLLILNAPASFDAELAQLPPTLQIARDAKASGPAAEFAIAFATRQTEVDKFAKIVARRAPGDAVIWFAYPKGSSKKYRCDFNRDSGWAALGALGLEPVRQVAVDEDWSALRFRRVEHIKNFTRASAISDAGRRRVK
ncbi:MAG: hypothetical protein IT162_16775 [Bryobacterales bacterium]|nr:hypothetical protein [Bryobacterales bacterium]